MSSDDELRAAFASVVKDNTALSSSEQLLLALQNTGRNPNKRLLSQFWSEETKGIQFDEFADICKKVPVTGQDDLMKAFRKMDLNGDGFISHSELRRVLTTKGEIMSDEEISTMIADVDENNDGKLDYKEFCNMVLNTSKKCQESAQKRLNRRQQQLIKSTGSSTKSITKQTPASLTTSVSSRRQRMENQSPKPNELGSTTSLRSERGSTRRRNSRTSDLGSMTSLNSEKTLTNGDTVPMPAPRRLSRQRNNKDPINKVDLKFPDSKKLAPWACLKHRGMMYLEENGSVSSNQYNLEVLQDSHVWIFASPSPYQSTATYKNSNLDLQLIIVKDKMSKGKSAIVSVTEGRDATARCGVKLDLKAGKYKILVTTSGCRLPVKAKSKSDQVELVKKKSSGQWVLTKQFKYVLTDIFNMVDSDMNGLLSRSEFNMYSVRTGEDEIGDEEWQVVQENTELKHDQLTCKGFIQLIELEAEDAEGDSDDLWLTLDAMGYGNDLIQTHAYPFTVEVYSESAQACKLAILTEYINNRSHLLTDLMIDAFFTKAVLIGSDNWAVSAETKAIAEKVQLLIYENESYVSVFIQNKLDKKVAVKLDCSIASKNIKTSTNSLTDVFSVDAGKSLLAYHIVPEDESVDWYVECHITNVKIKS